MNILVIINEEIQKLFENFSNEEGMDFLQLALMIGRLYDNPLTKDSPEIKAFVSILKKEYDKTGDSGVMKAFESYADVRIKPVGFQRYAFDYSTQNSASKRNIYNKQKSYSN